MINAWPIRTITGTIIPGWNILRAQATSGLSRVDHMVATG
jgi:hypothetical protein